MFNIQMGFRFLGVLISKDHQRMYASAMNQMTNCLRNKNDCYSPVLIAKQWKAEEMTDDIKLSKR